MSKTDDFIYKLQANLGNWTCSVCGTGSNQPAAIFREVKNRGYVFEKVSDSSWASSLFCKECGEPRSHYKLLEREPRFAVKQRISMSKATRQRILRLLDERDAFTGASIKSVPEIDHKVPWTRLGHDIDADGLSDGQLAEHFQLLTREHNSLKDKKCASCKASNQRPPFLEIPFWYSGGARYQGSCEGCGWYDGVAWREALARRLKT